MSTVCLLLLLVAAYADAQLPPYRSSATVLRDQCLPENAIANQTTDGDISDALRTIAEEIANGTSKCVLKNHNLCTHTCTIIQGPMAVLTRFT